MSMSIYIAHRRKQTPLMRSVCRVLIKKTKTRLQCLREATSLTLRDKESSSQRVKRGQLADKGR